MKQPFDKLAERFRRSRRAETGKNQMGQAVAKRILVVDDNEHSREGLRALLLGTGAEVESAADAWEAIRKIKEHPFDLAILDLDLPPVHGLEISGWDLVRILRGYNPSVSVIVVSAENTTVVRAEARTMRISEFLEKPISLPYLKGVIQSLIVSPSRVG